MSDVPSPPTDDVHDSGGDALDSSRRLSKACSGLGMMDKPWSLSMTFSLKVCGSGRSCSAAGSWVISDVSRGRCWLEKDPLRCWLEKDSSLFCADTLQSSKHVSDLRTGQVHLHCQHCSFGCS